ncbi:amidohydrolase family protein, partial [Streptomyces sp. SID3343]|uniref:amidohydrolase n=1 Tax=Streptomyces sp. SID3343 TaxID=2690260 RepID=UPI00136EE3FA
TCTAALLDPYVDAGGAGAPGHAHGRDHRGLSFVDPVALAEHVTRLDAAGLQVHFHTIGDRAVREVLDALQAAREANGWTDNRHHLAHIQVIHPDDVPRFRRLGAGANAQPLWAAHEPQMNELTIPVLGPERAAWQYPFADLAHDGAALAFGSDWPVSSPDPLWGMHVALNRTLPAGAAGFDAAAPAFLPAQRLDLPTALRAAIQGAAYLNHLDHETGSITVGRSADLVVLDRDLFETGSGALAEARVLLTLVEGRPVFASPDLHTAGGS